MTEDTRQWPAFWEALGRAIKVRRTGLAMSRRSLAEAAGLSYSYLAEIENGAKQPSSKAQHALADALGLTVSELMAAAESWAEKIQAGEATAFAETPAMHSAACPASMPEPYEPPPRHQSARARQLRWFGRPFKSGDADVGRNREELASVLRELSPEDRERVLDLARRLAGR